MQVKVVGIDSGKEYARGARIDCLRVLHKRYPSKPVESKFDNSTYPEPLIIKSIGVD